VSRLFFALRFVSWHLARAMLTYSVGNSVKDTCMAVYYSQWLLLALRCTGYSAVVRGVAVCKAFRKTV
jgi:hypothetical protein